MRVLDLGEPIATRSDGCRLPCDVQFHRLLFSSLGGFAPGFRSSYPHSPWQASYVAKGSPSGQSTKGQDTRLDRLILASSYHCEIPKPFGDVFRWGTVLCFGFNEAGTNPWMTLKQDGERSEEGVDERRYRSCRPY